MSAALAGALVLLALPLAVAAGYLLVLALLSVPPRVPVPPSPPTLRFDLVVPAHNEAAGIAATVHSLLAVDYPAALRRVVVVADNCSDDTAARAREAGAQVLERTDAERRGKGYALAHAFSHCLAEGFADAVVVVDADTVVSKNLLGAFGARLARGAVAVQAHYGVQNPEASWRTRLMRIALAMFHQVRSLGRERLGVSAGLRGNGMCFRASLLGEVPHEAFSLVEDLEYGLRLGRAGHRVAYAWEAEVLGEMVSGEQASRSQRARWEHGRRLMTKQFGWPLLREGLVARSGLLLDLAMDVLVPPLSRLVGAAGAGLVASTALVLLTGDGALAVGLFGGVLGCLGGYVFAGWLHSGTGVRGLVDLALAPAYLAWKVRLVFGGRGTKKPGEWVRTTREGETRS
jgi:1,2-diacylglycerol 3-beta-glucosyltransferase